MIGTPLAHRDRPEWEDLVGLFASSLPLRMRAVKRRGVRRGDRAGARHDRGRVRAPGRRVRTDRRSGGRAAQRRASSAVPGGARAAEHADAGARAAGSAGRAGPRCASGQSVRPGADVRRDHAARDRAAAVSNADRCDEAHGADDRRARRGLPPWGPAGNPPWDGTRGARRSGPPTSIVGANQSRRLRQAGRRSPSSAASRTADVSAARSRHRRGWRPAPARARRPARVERVAVCMERSRRSDRRAAGRDARPAAPTCRSIPTIRARASNGIIADCGATIVIAGEEHRALVSRARHRRAGRIVSPGLGGTGRRSRTRGHAAASRPAAGGLRHLHVGHDRRAQGRRGPASRGRAAARRDATRASASARPTSGRCSIRTRSISRSGRSGARSATARRLVVVPYWISRSPEDFARLIAAERVTVLNQTPTAFLPLVDHLDPARARRRCALVIFGGEALKPAQLRRWFDRFGDVRPELVNMYGITETTVHVTHDHIGRADAGGVASPIGQPIDDLRMHLLDARSASRRAWRDGRDFRRRARRGPRLPRSPEPDGGAVRARIRSGARRAAVSQRRPRALARRRASSTSGATTPDQAPRLPHRAGRDRSGADAAPGDARVVILRARGSPA